MSDYQCALCGSSVQEDTAIYHKDLDEWMLKIIVKQHPSWKESGGACPKCVEELKKRYKEVDEMEILPEN